MRIYLAGPEVFLPQAHEIGAAKKAVCLRHGVTGLFPLDKDVPPREPREEWAAEIYRANRALMDGADAVIANMTPFRGPSMDAGTAFEMGYMAALGKLVLGYTNTGGETYLQRLLSTGLTRGFGSTDLQGLAIEDFGLTDNLMMACAVRERGVEVFAQRQRRLQGLELYADLEAFEACVEAAVRARR